MVVRIKNSCKTYKIRYNRCLRGVIRKYIASLVKFVNFSFNILNVKDMLKGVEGIFIIVYVF